jgi:hypothetical protein
MIVVAVGLFAAGVTTASAQSITVQQPVVQTFSVDTVVTVPDRGSTLLGSMSSAGDSRSQYGFNPFGSSIGGYRNHSSAHATVYIHDFAAMDEALLNSGSVDGGMPVTVANPHARDALRQLTGARSRTPLFIDEYDDTLRLPPLGRRVAPIDTDVPLSPGDAIAVGDAGSDAEITLAPMASPSAWRSRFDARLGPSRSRERFGRGAQPVVPDDSSSSSSQAASLSTNSGDIPAASRASR